MALGVILIGGISLYILSICAFFYFCVIANPDENAFALYLTETLPNKCTEALQRLLGKRNMDLLQAAADRALIVLYCAIFFGAWSVIFFYIYPWLDEQAQVASDYTQKQQKAVYTVSRYHKYIGYFVFAACVASWRAASTVSPGIITARTISRYSHFPPDDILFPSHPVRICSTHKIPKLPRSKFDRYKYQHNVPRFDHFCGWVFNTIGEENYRWFLLFIVVHVGMCIYGTVIIARMFLAEVVLRGLDRAVFVDRATGEEFAASRFMIMQYMFSSRFMEACAFMLAAVMGATLLLFLAYHVYLTSRGMTTNESYKWSAVHKWYKGEVRRYKKAVAAGVVVPGEAAAAARQPRIEVTDNADINCTPTPSSLLSSSGASDVVQVKQNSVDGDSKRASLTNDNTVIENDNDDDMPQHPGPRPVNIYNRGLYENWMEVLFPISLRKDRTVEESSSNYTRSLESALATSVAKNKEE